MNSIRQVAERKEIEQALISARIKTDAVSGMPEHCHVSFVRHALTAIFSILLYRYLYDDMRYGETASIVMSALATVVVAVLWSFWSWYSYGHAFRVNLDLELEARDLTSADDRVY